MLRLIIATIQARGPIMTLATVIERTRNFLCTILVIRGDMLYTCSLFVEFKIKFVQSAYMYKTDIQSLI